MDGVFLGPDRLAAEKQRAVWPDRILTDYLDAHVAKRPDATALIGVRAEDGAVTRLTFGELNARAASVAQGLSDLGVVAGEVVSFQLPNWWEFVVIHLACLRLGAVSNPLMPIFRHHELSFMLSHARSRVFIAPASFRGFDHGALAFDLLREVSTLEHVVLVNGEGEHGFDQRLLGADAGGRFASGTALAPNDVVQLLYTSGTTGEPKGVMHTSNTLIGTTDVFASRIELTRDDVVFMPSPLAHQTGFTYGMVIALVRGAPLLLVDVWKPELGASVLAEHGGTYMFAATPFLSDLATLPDIERYDLSAFRVFVTSGAPIPPALVGAAREKLGGKLVTGWGMTECGIVSTTLLDDDKVLSSDGFALPGEEIRIVDDAGAPLPAGEEGRLQMRGAALFVGYHNRPDLYDVDEDGWFFTGDLGRMDDAGYLRIVGREKDIIIRGGENIPVVEVENAVYRMPQIAAAAIVAMPDPRLVERACLFAILKPGCTLTLPELTAYLDGEGLAKQFWPERIEIVDEMPRTPSGKIQKFVLREQAKSFVPPGDEAG